MLCALAWLTVTATVIAGTTKGPGGSDHYFGLLHTAFGQAALSPSADGGLRVSNLGSSGKDGVSISLGDTDGVAMELRLPESSSWPVSSTVCTTLEGPQADQYVRMCFVESGSGDVTVSLDMGDGAEPMCVHVELLLGGVVVDHSSLFVAGNDAPVAIASGGFGSIGGEPVAVNARKSPQALAVFVFAPNEIAASLSSSPTGTVQCDSMLISLDGLPPGENWMMKSASVTATGLKELVIDGEWLHAGPDQRDSSGRVTLDSYVMPIGGAHVTGVVGDVLCAGCPECCEELEQGLVRSGVSLDNLGSSGKDGVAFQCRPWGSPWFVDDYYLDVGSLSPSLCAPCALTMGARGTLSGQPDRDLGRCSVRNNAGTLELLADFTALGVVDVTVEVRDNGALVGSVQVPGGPGAVCGTLTEGPTGFNITKCGKQNGSGQPPCFVMCTDGPFTFSGGGQVLVGDDLRVLAVGGGLTVDALSEFSLHVTDMPSFMCAPSRPPGESPPLTTYGGVEVGGVGQASVVDLGDLDGDGYPELLVDNIGSSGKDGVSINIGGSSGARVDHASDFVVDSFFDITYRLESQSCPSCPASEVARCDFESDGSTVACSMHVQGSTEGTLTLLSSDHQIVATIPYVYGEPLTLTPSPGAHVRSRSWRSMKDSDIVSNTSVVRMNIEIADSSTGSDMLVSHPVHGDFQGVGEMVLYGSRGTGGGGGGGRVVIRATANDGVCSPCSMTLTGIAPVLFGRAHSAIGSARLHSSSCDDGNIQDERMYVDNLGSSGKDGVSLHLSDWLDDDSDNDSIPDIDEVGRVKVRFPWVPGTSSAQWTVTGVDSSGNPFDLATGSAVQDQNDVHVASGRVPWMAPESIRVRIHDEHGAILDQVENLSPGQLASARDVVGVDRCLWIHHRDSSGATIGVEYRYIWDSRSELWIGDNAHVEGTEISMVVTPSSSTAGSTIVRDERMDIRISTSNASSSMAITDEDIKQPTPDCLADFVTNITFQPPPDGKVDGADLAFLLTWWGPNISSLADMVDGTTFEPPPDGVVDGADLAVLLGAWGPCN